MSRLTLLLAVALSLLSSAASGQFLQEIKAVRFGMGCIERPKSTDGGLGLCMTGASRSRVWCPNGKVYERDGQSAGPFSGTIGLWPEPNSLIGKNSPDRQDKPQRSGGHILPGRNMTLFGIVGTSPYRRRQLSDGSFVFPCAFGSIIMPDYRTCVRGDKGAVLRSFSFSANDDDHAVEKSGTVDGPSVGSLAGRATGEAPRAERHDHSVFLASDFDVRVALPRPPAPASFS